MKPTALGSRRLFFVCPRLRLGQDGVGDYALRLGSALVDHGWAVRWAALNDLDQLSGYVAEEDCLRLPGSWHARQKAAMLNHWLKNWEPSWISLQWVGFGYEKHGLPWSTIRLIARLRKRRRLHVFFHEIWLGEKPGLSTRHRLLGLLQKQLTCHAVRAWNPDVIQTSNGLYQIALRRAGIETHILPLPGNLPLAETREDSDNDDLLRLVIFGSIDLDWEPELFTRALMRWAEERNRQVELTSLGGQGAGVTRWDQLREWVKKSSHVRLRSTGRLSAEAASRELERAHVGATTKSFELLGKSGAFAAMAEHGLPVIALRSPRESSFPIEPEQYEVEVLRFDPGQLDEMGRWLDRASRGRPSSRLPAIAARMDEILSQAEAS